MNIETITLDPKEALEKLKLYKDNLKRKVRSDVERHVTEEHKAAVRILKELGKGHAILDIEDVIRNAPIDSKERPKLAICRADFKQVRFRWETETNQAAFNGSNSTDEFDYSSLAKDKRIEVNMERQHHHTEIVPWRKSEGPIPYSLVGYSLVPLVPPQVEIKNKLGSYFILWEVENWSDTIIGAKPDRDPYLLKRLNTTLFAVVAEWDLTEVERLVMKRRL